MACRWEPSLNPFPRLFDVFFGYLLLLFFFSGFLPVLRTRCRWKSSLHPFPILFVCFFFLSIYCFFLRVFASFGNNLQICNTDWLVLLKVNFDFSCFRADVPFRGFVLNDAQTRRPTAQVSAAHAASISLRSSRSLHLSLRSTAQSFEQVTWRPVKHWLIKSCLNFVLLRSCKQKDRFCQLPFVSCHLETEEDLKHIWSEIEMMNCHLHLIARSESETAAVWEQLHKILAALWSEECLCWFMR